jgi:hypothetical protein
MASQTLVSSFGTPTPTTIMKTSAVIAAGLIASAQGFAPATQGRVAGTELSESLMSRVFGMDLFSPSADQNDYGARTKKNVSRTYVFIRQLLTYSIFSQSHRL